jgi:hypothetical protein
VGLDTDVSGAATLSKIHLDGYEIGTTASANGPTAIGVHDHHRAQLEDREMAP